MTTDSKTNTPEEAPLDLTTSPAETARRERAESIWNIPNQLTVARLILSVIFFVLMALETHKSLPFGRQAALNIAFVLFVSAVLTDFLDGFLARRWNLTSTFGRIADPFADKIVIVGGFIMLTAVTTLIEPWFAVVIMFREFLVSGLRSFLESRGVAFGAVAIGKIKMVVQSVAIPAVLLYEANFAPGAGEELTATGTFFWYVAVATLVLTLVLTVVSCVSYLHRAYRLIRA